MTTSKEEKMQAHPGFAIKLDNGNWLGVAHGYHQVDDALIACTFETKPEALRALKEAIDEGYFDKDTKGEAVEAWEPLCESLRWEISKLRKANKISPKILSDVVFEIENALSMIKVD